MELTGISGTKGGYLKGKINEF